MQIIGMTDDLKKRVLGRYNLDTPVLLTHIWSKVNCIYQISIHDRTEFTFYTAF